MSKTVLFCLALVGSMASAQAKVAGTVQATYCGSASEDTALEGVFINKVCTSNIVGITGEFITVQELEGADLKPQNTIWEITTQTPSAKGVTVTVVERGYMENGIFKANNVSPTSDGQIIIKMSDSGAPVEMRGILAGRKFKAANFRGLAVAKAALK